ncbi:unnamed protein product [Phytophthora lilii]|uniref:Unnamed protein product n=1 Tax=Phytophthora lilii TaxID=2077276 RepID=A0A9W6UC20_9STRA|nr:unnamed protein product [Phytophthora lilii]
MRLEGKKRAAGDDLEYLKVDDISLKNMQAKIYKAIPDSKDERTEIAERIFNFTEVEHVRDYLKKIDPVSWTLLSNYFLSKEEFKWLQDNWPPPYGLFMPLFGVTLTSAIEGQNNELMWSGLRDSFPIQAFKIFALATLNRKLRQIEGW